MLFGGLFLYISYYGTDQTQVQRELSSQNIDDTNRSLMLNGMMRFPLVLPIVWSMHQRTSSKIRISQTLDDGTGSTNYNLAVPKFVTSVLPNGVIGLVIVALFSAAMSSLDSTINSLLRRRSKIFMNPLLKGRDPAEKQLVLSRFFTVLGGVDCLLFVFCGRYFEFGDRIRQQ